MAITKKTISVMVVILKKKKEPPIYMYQASGSLKTQVRQVKFPSRRVSHHTPRWSALIYIVWFEEIDLF